MNKTELIERLAEKQGTSKAEAGRIVDALFGEDGIIADRLASGGSVLLSGFGLWTTRRVEARAGRNPRTGEAITIPAHRRPSFRAGKGLKDRVNP